LQRSDRLKRGAAAAAQVTLLNVEAYITDLTTRVSSVAVWNCIYKLRRAAELLVPAADFSWLSEIEKDLALVMEPRSKFDRLVFSGRLVEAGLTLVARRKDSPETNFVRARGVRNGLMIALLALHGKWWIALPSSSTKTDRQTSGRFRHCSTAISIRI
jgi:hypothetical protein